jgi:protein involved in polysaccharide export with SLBB domain
MLLNCHGPTSQRLAIFIVGLGLVRLVFLGQAKAAQTNNEPEVLSSAARDYLNQVGVHPFDTNGAQAQANLPAAAAQSATLVTVDALDDEHKLGIGDRVSFRIDEDKLLDEKNDPIQLYVTDSGELEIPYLGRIPALGKTCLQLAKEVKAVLEKKYYYHATVLLGVDVLNKTRGRVYLAGKVKLPGYLDIPSDETFTVSKAIMRAGGFSEFADKRHVKVTRGKGPNGSEGETVVIDVADVLEKGLAGKDLPLAPDDRVFVPSKLINF